MGFNPNEGGAHRASGAPGPGDKPHVTAEWLRLIQNSRLNPAQIAALVLFFDRATGGLNAASLTPAEIGEARRPLMHWPLMHFVPSFLAVHDALIEAHIQNAHLERSLRSSFIDLRDPVNELFRECIGDRDREKLKRGAIKAAAMALRLADWADNAPRGAE